MARTKSITIEGQEFLIAPLNMEQVENLMDEDVSDDIKRIRARGYRTIIESLGNAGQTFDEKTLKQSLDYPTYNELLRRIHEFSGLRTLGEVQAATGSGSTSTTSEAA